MFVGWVADPGVLAVGLDLVDAEVGRSGHVAWADRRLQGLDERQGEAEDRLLLRDFDVCDVRPDLGASRRAGCTGLVDRPCDDLRGRKARHAEEVLLALA